MREDQLRHLVEIRVQHPEAVAEAAAARVRPTSLLGEHGRLMMIAADHPARGALRAGDRPFAMGDRSDLLDRLVLALSRPGVNGVLGTPDVLEDLLLLGALDDKVVVGSMNRGGLAGTAFEMDDRFTAYDASSIAASGFEGGKMLTRIDAEDPSTVATLEACARAVGDLAEHRLMAMVEPFISHRVDGRVRNELTSDAMIRAMTVAAGLGRTSAYTWLKVPIVDEMERAMAATTLPAVILGGEVSADPDAVFASWSKALALPTVQGLVIGRSLLYPPDDDVAKAVDVAVGVAVSEYIIRDGESAEGPFSLVITPKTANWGYSSLRVLTLAAGESATFGTGEDETVVLPLSGACVVECDGERFELAGRDSVFSRVTDFAYVPRDAQVTVSSEKGGRFALPAARATKRLTARYGPAEGVQVELRGAGQASRQVNNFCNPASFEAEKLIAVEVLTPGGNWSSFPPHKHDEERDGESVLEEIYYFEVGNDGPGYQRVYTSGPGREIDVCTEVRTGDTVLIPHGWHGPSMAAPGYDLYYLNVMAGPSPDRAWLICDDPAHAWVRGTWDGQDIDPRLPMSSTEEKK